jgi:CDP-diacylglycerol---serine O-phosphatidyltransferase
VVHSIWYKKIPTLLTIGNSLCGFTAILWCLQAYEKSGLTSGNSSHDIIPHIFSACAWLILAAMVFDAMDGWTARKLKATSLHGIQMDSLADMVTFGVAPAVVVAISAHINGLEGIGKGYYNSEGFFRYDRMVWMACGIYMACAACRLALYNVHAIEEKKDENFTGIPSPGAAAAVCSIIILNTNSKFEMPESMMTIVLPIYTACLGLLMISTIPYPHMGKWLISPVKRNRKFFVLGTILALCIYESIQYGGPKMTAAAIITAYVFSGPIKYFYEWITGKHIADDDEQVANTL